MFVQLLSYILLATFSHVCRVVRLVPIPMMYLRYNISHLFLDHREMELMNLVSSLTQVSHTHRFHSLIYWLYEISVHGSSAHILSLGLL